jgi:cysteinyl-tRNA synthetase
VLDVLPSARSVAPELTAWVEDQVALREKARRAKDFREADRIRGALKDRGIELDDTPQGTKWRAL